jgi:hypothetical protein
MVLPSISLPIYFISLIAIILLSAVVIDLMSKAIKAPFKTTQLFIIYLSAVIFSILIGYLSGQLLNFSETFLECNLSILISPEIIFSYILPLLSIFVLSLKLHKVSSYKQTLLVMLIYLFAYYLVGSQVIGYFIGSGWHECPPRPF